MNNKHTPGPWEVVGDSACDDLLTIAAEGRAGKVAIAEIQIGFDEPFEAEQIANARLIAAAPALLAALVEFEGCEFAMRNKRAYGKLVAVLDSLTP